MCGICLLVRQKLARAATTPAPSPSPPSTSTYAPPQVKPSAAPQCNPFYPEQEESAPVPRQSQSHAGGGGGCFSYTAATAAHTHSLTPCVCAQAGLEVKRFLTGHADAVDSLFAEMLHNLRRRGPNTYGVTRRSFSAVCHMPTDSTVSLLHPAQQPVGYGVADVPVNSDAPAPAAAYASASAALSVKTEVAGVASVLGLRGHSTVAQPYDMNVETDAEEDGPTNSWDYRSSLLLNGEIFGGALCPPPWGSDTVLLASRLSQMELECVSMTEDATTGSPLLPLAQRQRFFLRKCTTLFEQQVEGPYCFIFIATRLRLAVFGRDPLGRHSLLTHVRVTAPPPPLPRHTGAATSAPAPAELDVEIIVSSVGVQHRAPANAASPASASTTPAAAAPSAAPSPLSSSSHVASSASGGSANNHHHHNGGCDGSGATAGAASKRPRHERAPHGGAAPLPLAPLVEAGEEEEEEGGAGGCGSGEVCWQEVGVTGLFGVPLQAPLVYRDPNAAATAAAAANASGPAEETPATSAQASAVPHLHPVCVASLPGGAGGNALVAGAHVLLLHCPWHRTNHLVHPLLRTAALPMMPLEPPPFERILAHEEIAVLPEALLQWTRHLMKSIQPEGAPDQSWVDWAAAHYMLALAVSMHRRITVANSGAADGRDAQELSTARRRPLCILFSGGIDCTVIAALAHYLLPVETPIELVNVAFGDTPEQAPDRVAAFRSMEELLRLPLLPSSCDDTPAAAAALSQSEPAPAPEREWRLVLVDVPSKASADSAHIKDLLVPRHTVMDLDIGTALWHAARAAGRMQVLRRSDVAGAAAAAASAPSTVTCTPTSPSAPLRGRPGSPTVTLDGFSKHFRAYTSATPVACLGGDTLFPGTAPQSGSHAHSEAAAAAAAATATPTTTASGVGATATAAPAAHDPEAVANTQKYQILVDILVKEGRNGGGPQTPVLLSTLGKEYSLFLQPHIKRYGYKKLGSFLNDAAKAGYVKFSPDAPSKAVRLCRANDMARAVAVPPSPWFTTEFMKAQGGVEPVDGLHVHTGVAQPPLPRPGTCQASYVSDAKVVLLGMGADETLGGYTRYRRFFQREGMPGARRELERDFARLWQRNLGRDDRITMDSGREPRFPFLDEGVVRTLEWIVLKRRNNILAAYEDLARHANESAGSAGAPSTPTMPPLPRAGLSGQRDAPPPSPPPLTEDELLRLAMEPIVSFRLNPGEGDKRVLRRVAAVLGLSDVTHLQKRAIQFGSRIAERKIKGTNDF